MSPLVTSIICNVLWLANILLLAWVILGYIQAPWGSPVRRIRDGLDKIFQPILTPLRRILPPVRFGTFGLDLSPLVVFGIIFVLVRVICR